jgi:L-lactate dehydrogenase
MKVTIIGPGKVGMVLAYTLMRAGAIDDAAGSEVVAVCASVPMPSGLLSRNALAQGNAELMKKLLPRVAEVAPLAKLVMVTNPVDVLTWKALELTGFPRERVMGTGTLVDSVRFRELLSEMLHIHPDDLRAYILGEHGEHQFPAMSVAQAGGERIDDTPERRELCERAKHFGIEVFQKKGNTCYAIGQAAAYIIEAILLDEKRTVPLSVRIDGYLGVSGVCLSVPVVVGRRGVERYLHPDLNADEAGQFRAAAEAVRAVIEGLG